MKIAIAIYAFGLLAVHHQAYAAPTTEEVEAAKRTQAVAEAAKATAEANKATIEADAAAARANLGTLDLSKFTAPATEVKKLGVEGELLAYAAVKSLAKTIVEQIKTPVGDKVVVIYSEKELKAVQRGASFSLNLAALDKDIAKLSIPPLPIDDPKCAVKMDAEAGGGGLGALGSLDVAAQVLSLFKITKVLEGAPVTVDEFALSAAVLAQLKVADIKAIYPPIFFTTRLLKAPATSQIETDTESVTVRAPGIDLLLAAVARRKEVIKERLKSEKKPTVECKGAISASIASLDLIEARAQVLKSRAAKYIEAVRTVDEKTGNTLLETLVEAEALRKAAIGGLVLQLKPIAAGGSTLTKTTFFSSNFRFSGGAIVAYMLTDGTDGKVKASGLIGEYGGNSNLDGLADVLKEKTK